MTRLLFEKLFPSPWGLCCLKVTAFRGEFSLFAGSPWPGPGEAEDLAQCPGRGAGGPGGRDSSRSRRDPPGTGWSSAPVPSSGFRKEGRGGTQAFPSTQDRGFWRWTLGQGSEGTGAEGRVAGGLSGPMKQGAAHLPWWSQQKQPVLLPSCARAPGCAQAWSGPGGWGGSQVPASRRLHRIRWLSLGAL